MPQTIGVLSQKLHNRRPGNPAVEEVRSPFGQSPSFKILKKLHEPLILREGPVELEAVEQVPLHAIGRDQVLDGEILLRDSLAQVVEHKFLDRLDVELYAVFVATDELRDIRRSLDLDQHRDGCFGGSLLVDHDIYVARLVDVVPFSEQVDQRVAKFVLVPVLSLVDVGLVSVEELQQALREYSHLGTQRLDFTVSLVEGLEGRELGGSFRHGRSRKVRVDLWCRWPG